MVICYVPLSRNSILPDQKHAGKTVGKLSYLFLRLILHWGRRGRLNMGIAIPQLSKLTQTVP